MPSAVTIYRLLQTMSYFQINNFSLHFLITPVIRCDCNSDSFGINTDWATVCSKALCRKKALETFNVQEFAKIQGIGVTCNILKLGWKYGESTNSISFIGI